MTGWVGILYFGGERERSGLDSEEVASERGVLNVAPL